MVVVRPEDAVGAHRSGDDAEPVGELLDMRTERRELASKGSDAVCLVPAQVVDAGEGRRPFRARRERRDDRRELATVTQVEVGAGDGAPSRHDEFVAVATGARTEPLEDLRQGGAGLTR